ncbi:S1 RNA-binding domain-containing protein [Planctomicrobium sp. SH668]|uniref:30S ribosomal protein S1 n=1 Tax=Planctomicrobium sp. SH668 TaxID=3448126 RepID=UPI003F5C2219
MSTENQSTQDQNDSPTPPAGETSQPVSEVVAQKTEEAATPVASEVSQPAGDTPSEPAVVSEEPKKKFQLNPIPLSESSKSVPTLDESSLTAAAISGEAGEASAEAKPAKPQSPPAPHQAVPLPGNESIDDALAADIEAAMAGEATAAAVPASAAEAVTLETMPPGHKLTGIVLSVNGDSVFIDVNQRLSAAVPFRQFDAKKPPQVGESVTVAFEKIDETEGLIIANLPRGTTVVKGGDWSAVAPDQVVECMVTKTNKGGLEATVGSLRGFIPASQVELGYVADLEQYVGQKLRVRITEVNPAKKKLVLSRRVLLAEEREVAKGQLLEEIKPDQTRTGRVKTIKEYGAFIDLGGMDGFLPIAQLSWVRIEHPSEVLTEGQEIEVKVLSVDVEKNRISLGMRQLAPNPWRSAEAKYAKGSNATGRVTRTEAFGAFVELEPGVEGLVHISELEHRRVKRVEEVLKVGDMVEVQILEVDPKKKRISLSAKALKDKPEPVVKPSDEDLAPGQGQVYERKRKDGLKGGTGSPKAGGLFGNPTDF